MWDFVFVDVKLLKYSLVLCALLNLSWLILSGFRLGALLCLRFAAALACSNSVFVVFRQRQSEWVHVKFVATGAADMELQFFRFFESL